MSTARILIVDDQREVSRLLRSSLELSGRNVNVTAVPSGEEALLEMKRAPIDLLVTDLRLPGMSGLELLARVRSEYPESQGILITGQPTEDIRKEAEDLGVVAFISKPASVDGFLDAVDAALFRRHAEGIPPIPEQVKPRLVVRIESIRYEAGAAAVYLFDRNGVMVVKSGGAEDVSFLAALPSMLQSLSSGLQASNLMGAYLPFNFQMFEGDGSMLVLRNVGAYYVLLLQVDQEETPVDVQQIDSVSRKAAADVLDFLSSMTEEALKRGRVEVEEQEEEGQGEMPDDIEERELDLDSVMEEPLEEDAGQFWDEAVSSSGSINKDDDDTLTYDEAMNKGLLADDEA